MNYPKLKYLRLCRLLARVEPVTKWSYPKSQPIGKKVIQKISEHIRAYFTKQGFTVEFTMLDERRFLHE